MDKSVFIEHRNKVLKLMDDNSILISFNRPKQSSGVFKETYDVNRNYWFLCGIFEYENIVVLTKINGATNSMIYINPYDELKAKWVGAPMSKEEVINISGIETVRYLDTFNDTIYKLISSLDSVYLDLPKNNILASLTEDEMFAKVIKDKAPWVRIKNANKLFLEARTIKHPLEVEEMKKAIEITAKGIDNILSHIGPMYEYQLESYFDQAVKYNGATGYSFPTIAASGKNACCLHYMENNDMCQNGDLILFDLGASLNMYCADISRTYPISGKFTERQKTLYNIVLGGQELVFKSAKPGVTTRGLNEILKNYYAIELAKIGLISKPEEVSKYYYHGVSHHIGLDCHDLCDYGPLKAGSIISNEPGLYIAEEGIGIRIEDDILITETGAEWLSPQILKKPEDIEKFIKENRK